MSDLLTIQDVAQRLGVHEVTVSRWINSGPAKKRMPCIRRGPRWVRVTETQLAGYLKKLSRNGNQI